MTVEYKNVRRINAVSRAALSAELADRMIGVETTSGYLGAKKPGGEMKYYAPEGSDALFNSITVSKTTPTAANELTSKAYVDNAVSLAGAVPLSDVLIAGNDAGAKQIRNILDGTTDQDAVSLHQTKDIAALYSLSSSVVSGFAITQASPTTVNIATGVIAVVDKSNPLSPIITQFSFPAQNGIAISGLATQGYTTLQINPAGTITQTTNTIPNSDSQQSNVRIGVIAHIFGTGAIEGISNWWTCGHSAEARLNSILQHIGVSKKGISLSAFGSALRVKTTSGQLCADGLDADVNSNSPDIQPVLALNPAPSIIRLTRSSFYDTSTDVDVTQYDLNGTKTAIPGPSNTATIHRVYMTFNNLIAIQLGQNTYGTTNDALIALSEGSDSFTEHPVLNGVSIRIGYIIASKGTTNLSTTAIFRNTDKWGDDATAGGGGAVIPDLAAVLTAGSNAGNIDITGISRLTANTGTSYMDLDSNVTVASPLGSVFVENQASQYTIVKNNGTEVLRIGATSQTIPNSTIDRINSSGPTGITSKKYVDWEVARALTGSMTTTPDNSNVRALGTYSLPSGAWSDWVLPLYSNNVSGGMKVTVTGYDSTNAIGLTNSGTVNNAGPEYVNYESNLINGGLWKFIKYTTGGSTYYGVRFFYIGSVPLQVKVENVGGYGFAFPALIPFAGLTSVTTYDETYSVARKVDINAMAAYSTFTFGKYANTGVAANTGVGIPQATDGTINAPKGFMPIRTFTTSTVQSVLGHIVNNYGSAISITIQLRYIASIGSTGLAPTDGNLAGSVSITTNTSGGGNAFAINGTSTIPANSYVWLNVVDSTNTYSQTNCAGTIKLA